MSLSSAWKKTQYLMADLGITDPPAVRRTLLDEGWTFDTIMVPGCIGYGGGSATFIKTPEGVSIEETPEARRQYNDARHRAVVKIFSPTK